MIPLARSIFWGPMAITIMGGLLIATVLTLLVVPALYALWFRVQQDELDRSVIIAEALAENDDMEPIRIAAE
jgi:Cu/Ag efflux pump CusA